MDKKQYIGVFDSGIGGLNELNNLVEEFPNENFLYLGDNLNVPYGVKTADQLKEIISKIFRYFEKEEVKAIVIACNTASVASMELESSVPVFRIIEPTAKNALKVWNVWVWRMCREIIIACLVDKWCDKIVHIE